MDKLIEAIKTVERAHFRTIHDSGAEPHAMLVMNAFRLFAGMESIKLEDLPAWNVERKAYVMPANSRLLDNY